MVYIARLLSRDFVDERLTVTKAVFCLLLAIVVVTV